MTFLIAGILIFFGVHLVRVAAPAWRERKVARLGPGPWRGLYSAVSIAGFVLLLMGYGRVKDAGGVLWTPPDGARLVAAAAMLPAFILLVATYVPGRIRAAVRHPMLLATLIWSAAHLLTNGALADVLLFGSFFAWAAVVTADAWRRTDAAPPPSLPAGRANDLIVVVVGAALWLALVAGGHRWLFGAPILA
jgi:uncharacterized membrane protein